MGSGCRTDPRSNPGSFLPSPWPRDRRELADAEDALVFSAAWLVAPPALPNVRRPLPAALEALRRFARAGPEPGPLWRAPSLPSRPPRSEGT